MYKENKDNIKALTLCSILQTHMYMFMTGKYNFEI